MVTPIVDIWDGCTDKPSIGMVRPDRLPSGEPLSAPRSTHACHRYHLLLPADGWCRDAQCDAASLLRRLGF